jgi:5-methylcytosine-specific restriction endonuclease McrA
MPPIPKPEPIKKLKARKKRQQAAKAKAFRDAVWKQRDHGRCRVCGGWCFRGLEGLTGHVHHLRGRRVDPVNKYNPQRAVLLCAGCHRAVHSGKIKLVNP